MMNREEARNEWKGERGENEIKGLTTKTERKKKKKKSLILDAVRK